MNCLKRDGLISVLYYKLSVQIEKAIKGPCPILCGCTVHVTNKMNSGLIVNVPFKFDDVCTFMLKMFILFNHTLSV